MGVIFMSEIKSNSPFLNIQVGGTVMHGSQAYVVTHLLDIETILAKSCNTGQVQRLRISELSSGVEIKNIDISGSTQSIPDEDWNEAMRRFEIIMPLLTPGVSRTRLLVEERAKQFEVSTSALYRWIAQYETTRVVSSLVRKKRSDKGAHRITPEVEAIIQSCIKELYLNNQRYKIPTVCENIIIRCKRAGLPTPHPNTIRTRIAEIADSEKLSRRRSGKEAFQKYDPNRGAFPGADYPLAVVQIDHTPLDIIVVDQVTRCPIGRPWITLAFDVYSRMVCGFYIAMEHPSTMSLALCVAHAILPKERWLANRDISFSWPVWGVPDNFHVDNAKEFRGKSIKRACDEYGVIINWRPAAQPHYGGHIERMLGTLSSALHEAPGATFSNTKERGYYDSDAKAIMTLSELETWITVYVIGRYHQQVHSEIGMPPIRKYEEAILGNGNILGRGLPPRIEDENRVLLDFMPYVERTIQNYGVAFENIEYYSNVLRRWIHSTNPENKKLKRKFIFKYDPRDISQIFFLDPELNIYYPIPYKNTARPAISIWELREARRHLAEQGNSEFDEDMLFRAYERLREIEKNATSETKKVRRSTQQRKDTVARQDYRPILPKHKSSIPENGLNEIEATPVQAFDDIDEDINL